jgi:hypothetical protein
VLADISQPIYEYTAKIAHQVPALYDPLQQSGPSTLSATPA